MEPTDEEIKTLPVLNISKPLSHLVDEWKPRKIVIDEYNPNIENNVSPNNEEKRKTTYVIDTHNTWYAN